MKFNVRRKGHPKRTVEGTEARDIYREVLRDISQSILAPVMPFTGRIRRRSIERLREGDAIWTHPDENGQATDDSTILNIPREIVGIIHADGTYEDRGAPDPRKIEEKPKEAE